jgi:TRAP transporter TAXI family solute receptor
MSYLLKSAAAFAVAASLGSAALAQDRTGWPSSFSVGTASQGGVFFIYGQGWANLVSEIIGVPSSTEVTDGPVQNATGVQDRDFDFGMVTMGPAWDAINGLSPLAPGVKHDAIRAIFPMYNTGFHFIALRSSGITSLSDIPNGARVGVGPQGGTPGTYIPQIMEALGKTVEIRYGGAADLAGQLQDGLIDVFGFAAGIPFPAFAQVEAQLPVTFIGMTEAEQALILEKLPVNPFVIPQSAYSSMPGDQLSVSMWNFAIGHADLPESFVYEVVKAVMENHERMVGIHRAAVETVPENFDKNLFIPWHPGAVRYFEEKGFRIADELRG